MEITVLKDHQQSRLIQHGNTIETLENTLVTIRQEDSPNEAQINEYKHLIETEKDRLREFVETLKAETGEVNTETWVDEILGYIEQAEKWIDLLPNDIAKVVRLVLEQIKKVLLIIKTL
jgi:hypothetical protein